MVIGLVVICAFLWALFYGAAHRMIGPSGDQVCGYADFFCRQPAWFLGIAGAALVWAFLLRLKR